MRLRRRREQPLVDLLLEALGTSDQVGAAADGTAMVLTRTDPMVLVQLRSADGSAMTATVVRPGADYVPPPGGELDAGKEALIRDFLAGPHSEWDVLAEHLGDDAAG